LVVMIWVERVLRTGERRTKIYRLMTLSHMNTSVSHLTAMTGIPYQSLSPARQPKGGPIDDLYVCDKFKGRSRDVPAGRG
jgi:hypothetical protein